MPESVCEAPRRSLAALATWTAGQLAAAHNCLSLMCARQEKEVVLQWWWVVIGGKGVLRWGRGGGGRLSASPASLRTSELAVQADKRRRRRQSC